MKVEKLDWDSTFFGIEIGSVFIEYENDFKQLEQALSIKNPHQLIYLFSKQPIKTLKLIDERVEFERQLEDSEPFFNDDIKIWNGNTTKELIELSIVSGHQSRFKKDAVLNPKFEQLYTRWIEKSVDGTLADYVLVAQENNKIVGMLTLKLRADFSEIGLVAVGLKQKGIGKKLMQKAFQISQKHNKNKIKVVTQKENTEAMLFYNKLGFNICKTTFVYHLHFKNI